MMTFIYHDSCKSAIEKASRKHRTIHQGLESFQRLCEKQFHPLTPQQVIGPAKLHRLTQNDLWSLWKIELVLPKSGLRPSQFPRMWFVVKGATIVCLCIGFHSDNYDDAQMTKCALERASDFF